MYIYPPEQIHNNHGNLDCFTSRLYNSFNLLHIHWSRQTKVFRRLKLLLFTDQIVEISDNCYIAQRRIMISFISSCNWSVYWTLLWARYATHIYTSLKKYLSSFSHSMPSEKLIILDALFTRLGWQLNKILPSGPPDCIHIHTNWYLTPVAVITAPKFVNMMICIYGYVHELSIHTYPLYVYT